MATCGVASFSCRTPSEALWAWRRSGGLSPSARNSCSVVPYSGVCGTSRAWVERAMSSGAAVPLTPTGAEHNSRRRKSETRSVWRMGGRDFRLPVRLLLWVAALGVPPSFMWASVVGPRWPSALQPSLLTSRRPPPCRLTSRHSGHRRPAPRGPPSRPRSPNPRMRCSGRCSAA
jgi:hypothetical protein